MIVVVLFIVAGALFGLAAFNVAAPINLVAGGLLIVVVAVLVSYLPSEVPRVR